METRGSRDTARLSPEGIRLATTASIGNGSPTPLEGMISQMDAPLRYISRGIKILFTTWWRIAVFVPPEMAPFNGLL